MSERSGDVVAAIRDAGDDASRLLALLHELRTRPRDDAFWASFVAATAMLCRARCALALARDDDAGAWQRLTTATTSGAALDADAETLVAEHGDRILEQGFARIPVAEGTVVATVVLGTSAPTVLLLEIPARERSRLNELILRARLVCDLPAAGPAASAAGDGLVELLDTVTRVMREERFGAAAIALVNGLVARLGCAQVALGWADGGYVRVAAISHLDRFERKTENVQLLEAAFEEALDQESDVDHPRDAGSGLVTVAHERFCRALAHDRAVSLILRRGDAAPEAVLLLADDGGTLDADRLARVRFAVHLLLPWLADFRRRDRWFGARLAEASRERLARLVGPEHPVRKTFAALLGFALLYVLLGTWPHEIEATGQLRTDATRLVSAPYEGFLDAVFVTAGDTVDEGAPLAALDVQDLHLQESEVRADLRRYEAEADQARAAGEMAEMEIASARMAQARARLERVLFLLGQARIEAPFDGVVVEGERSELLGKPLRQGDRIFRIARVEGLYAVLDLPERDLRYVEEGGTGEFRLLAQPSVSIPFTIETLIPVAEVRGQDGNHFRLKVRLETSAQAWWRPGMAGMARIDAGRRNIAWLLTHRLLDRLRILFWW